MTDSSFPDHFTPSADSYRSFRPTYPDALFDLLAEACEQHETVWECGAGSGQATVGLAQRFGRVLATDASPGQLGRLEPPVGRKVHRVACLAERAPLPDACADLVAVGQALHWFRLEPFYAEVRRVARPGGVIAAWTYGLCSVGPAVDVALRAFHATVESHWPEQRRHVDALYRDLPFPFDEIAAPPLEIRRSMTAGEFLGYLGTWSAVRRAREAGLEPLVQDRDAIEAAWGGPEVRREVVWPVGLRVGRVR